MKRSREQSFVIVESECLEEKPKRHKSVFLASDIQKKTIRTLQSQREIQSKVKDYIKGNIYESLIWIPPVILHPFLSSLYDPMFNSDMNKTLTILVEDEYASEVIQNVIQSFTEKKNEKSKHKTFYKHVLFIDQIIYKDPEYSNRICYIRTKEQARNFVTEIESNKRTEQVVLTIPVSKHSDIDMYTFLERQLCELEGKQVLKYYILQEADTIDKIAKGELSEEAQSQISKTKQMKWNVLKTNAQAKDLIKVISPLNTITRELVVFPPQKGLYIYLFLRKEWITTILCTPGFEHSTIYLCDAALRAYAANLAILKCDVAQENRNVQNAIMNNLSCHSTNDTDTYVVTITLGVEKTLIMLINDEVCGQGLSSVDIQVSPEMVPDMEHEIQQLKDMGTDFEFVQNPRNSLVQHASIMLPLFQPLEEAKRSMISHLRDFCHNSSPGAMIMYKDDELIEMETQRKRNLWHGVASEVGNILYCLVSKFKQICDSQADIMEVQNGMQSRLLALEKEIKRMKGKRTDKRRKDDPGTIYFVGGRTSSWRIKYRNNLGYFKGKNVSQYIVTKEGKIPRPLSDLRTKAKELGLSDTAIDRSFTKLKEIGQLHVPSWEIRKTELKTKK